MTWPRAYESDICQGRCTWRQVSSQVQGDTPGRIRSQRVPLPLPAPLPRKKLSPGKRHV